MSISQLNRKQCIEGINANRTCIKGCLQLRKLDHAKWMALELRCRNELIALRQRLIEIEAIERDALSLALQRAQLDAENKRAQ